MPQADNRLSIIVLRLAILFHRHIIIVNLHEFVVRLLLDIICRFFRIFTVRLAHFLGLHVVFLGWMELRWNWMECCDMLGRIVLCFYLFEHFEFAVLGLSLVEDILEGDCSLLSQEDDIYHLLASKGHGLLCDSIILLSLLFEVDEAFILTRPLLLEDIRCVDRLGQLVVTRIQRAIKQKRI